MGVRPTPKCACLILLAASVLACGFPPMALAQAQPPSTLPTTTGDTPNGTGTAAPTDQQPAGPQSTGSVAGTVVEQDGGVAIGARVELAPAKASKQQVFSGDNGEFSFADLPAGPFQLTVSAPGFDTKVFSGTVRPGETFLVPKIALSVTPVTTSVEVSLPQVEVAQEQIEVQEQQRILGFIPNFYVSYVPDAAPLVPRQKFQLAWKSTTDPITFLGTALFAGISQAANQYPGYGQGMQGYGKRYGAIYADVVVSTFVGGAVMPSLLKQDPRYFYQGTGTTKSRLIHALSYSVMCRGDNKKTQVNYSSIIGDFVAGGVTYFYTPASDRSASMVIENSLIRIAEDSVAGVFQEFVLARYTSRGRAKKASASRSSKP